MLNPQNLGTACSFVPCEPLPVSSQIVVFELVTLHISGCWNCSRLFLVCLACGYPTVVQHNTYMDPCESILVIRTTKPSRFEEYMVTMEN